MVAGERAADAHDAVDRREERVDLAVAAAGRLALPPLHVEDDRRLGPPLGAGAAAPGEQLVGRGVEVLLVLLDERDDVGVVDPLLAVGQRDEALVEPLQAVGVHFVAQLLQARAEAGTAGVLAHHQPAPGPADRLGGHDLVGRALLQHAVLVDAGLVREGVGAHDRLVRRHNDPGVAADQRADPAERLTADAAPIGAVVVAARAQRHHDLLQRGVAGPLAEAVDRHLDLPRARADCRDRVGGRQPEVVVVVATVDHAAGQLRRALRDPFADGGEHPRALVRQRVADGVGQVDRRRAGPDRHLADPAEEIEVGAGRVLGRELDIVAEVAGVAHHRVDPLQHLLARHPELVPEVDVGGRVEDVDARGSGGA